MLRLIEVNIFGNLFFRSRFSFPVFRPFCWLLLRIAFAQSPLNIRNACCIRFRMSSFLFLSIIYTNRCRFVMFVVVSGRAIFSLRSSAFIRPYVRKIRKKQCQLQWQPCDAYRTAIILLDRRIKRKRKYKHTHRQGCMK